MLQTFLQIGYSCKTESFQIVFVKKAISFQHTSVPHIPYLPKLKQM